MSSVSDRMRLREFRAYESDSHPTTLARLRRGQRARVVGYGPGIDDSAARRLFDLGLSPGIEVEMVRRAPLRDPVVYRVGDYEIALRRQQSLAIQVDRVR